MVTVKKCIGVIWESLPYLQNDTEKKSHQLVIGQNLVNSLLDILGIEHHSHLLRILHCYPSTLSPIMTVDGSHSGESLHLRSTLAFFLVTHPLLIEKSNCLPNLSKEMIKNTTFTSVNFSVLGDIVSCITFKGDINLFVTEISLINLLISFPSKETSHEYVEEEVNYFRTKVKILKDQVMSATRKEKNIRVSSILSVLALIDSNVLLIQNGYFQKNTSPRKQTTIDQFFVSNNKPPET
jgi:hypothetical protein